MERKIRRIVVGVADFEEDPHLAPAVALAGALGAELHVVYALLLPDLTVYPATELGAFSPDAIREFREKAHARLYVQVRKLPRGERIHCHVVAAPAEAAILDVAEEVGADLVVVGATRRGKLTRSILGTTAQRVLRASTVPVLVNRRPSHGPPRRILLTTDLSDLSARAYERGMEIGRELAATEDVELRALLVLGYGLAPPPPLSREALEEAAETELDRFLKWVEPGAPASRGAIRTGEPAREILAEAEDWGADLLVLGTHGRTGASRFLIGSVAESALRSAPCDVLVIPQAEETAPVMEGGSPGLT
jgi:nucleotide-binding universal stress UspA family protein